MIEAIIVALVAIAGALFAGREIGKRSERDKQETGAAKRKEAINEAGNDVSGLGRADLDERLRKSARK